MTFEEYAKIMAGHMKALHEVMRDAREAAVRDLSPEGLREYREVRRDVARTHIKMAEFDEKHGLDVESLSGGT